MEGRDEGEAVKGAEKRKRDNCNAYRRRTTFARFVSAHSVAVATDIIRTKEPQMPEKGMKEGRKERRAWKESLSTKKRHKSWSGREGERVLELSLELRRGQSLRN